MFRYFQHGILTQSYSPDSREYSTNEKTFRQWHENIRQYNFFWLSPSLQYIFVEGISFRRDVQVAVRSDMSFPKGMENISDQSLLPRSMKSADKAAPGKDAIGSFFERLADDTGDKIPDNTEEHLPFFRKRDVHEQFVKKYALLHEGTSHTQAYFASTWKVFCRNIKVQRLSILAKYSVCEQLRCKYNTL